jgi:hypothetical protein
MQTQAMRTYQIAFTGRDEKGVLPMFTRVQAATGKGAVRGVYRALQPRQRLALGDPEDITDKLNKEAKEADSVSQK